MFWKNGNLPNSPYDILQGMAWHAKEHALEDNVRNFGFGHFLYFCKNPICGGARLLLYDIDWMVKIPLGVEKEFYA